MNEIRCKYQRKNYEVREIEYEEYTCYKCGRDFMIDLDQCDTKIDFYQYKTFSLFKCPYCGAQYRVHI